MAPDMKDVKRKVRRMAGVFISECKKAGYDIVITQGYRSISEQNNLYARGRILPGPRVTNARGGFSLHNYGVSFDIAFMKANRVYYPPSDSYLWEVVAKIGKRIGLEWGDRGYVDLPHFQYRAGYSLEDFQHKRINWLKFL